MGWQMSHVSPQPVRRLTTNEAMALGLNANKRLWTLYVDGGDYFAVTSGKEWMHLSTEAVARLERRRVAALDCGHANEAPAKCPCGAGCFCRKRGNTCVGA